MARLLIVDDDPLMRRGLERSVRGEGYVVTLADGLASALRALTLQSFDVVLLDLHLGDGYGTDLLTSLAGRPHPPAVVMLSGESAFDHTARAIQYGACEFLLKPFDHQELIDALAQALAGRGAASQPAEPSPELAPPTLVGTSPRMRSLYKDIARVARTDVSVMITGETGSGKELVARALHEWSARREQPFVAVNCAALSSGLLEAELFGASRGAFTGALQDRVGRIEAADGGTLFLDEIGELDLALQPKLLRVLQERCFERVGETRPRSFDVRVVAATNRDLGDEIAGGSFRADLFHRLDAVSLQLPPLRERGEDLAPLCDDLLRRIGHELGIAGPTLDPAALPRLRAHTWPGNVRELRNVLQRALVLSGSGVVDERALDRIEFLQPSDDDAGQVAPDRLRDGPPTLAQLERTHIQRVLGDTGWHKRRACALLGISRPTLDRKIRAYRLTPGEA